MGRLLDSYDRLQASPLGSTSALRNDSGLRQLGSQRRDLTSALRRGIREAKREGNAERVLKYQQMGDRQGLQTSGIGSAERRMQGDDLAYTQRGKESGMNADLANRAADGVNKIGAAPQVEIGTDKTGGPTAAASTNLDGSPRAGASFAARATQEPAPRLSFDEQEKASVRRSTLDGSFGTGARDKMRREDAASMIDSAIDYEIGTGANGEVEAKPILNEDKVKGALSRVAGIGGTEKSFRDAIQRQMAGSLRSSAPGTRPVVQSTDTSASDGAAKYQRDLAEETTRNALALAQKANEDEKARRLRELTKTQGSRDSRGRNS